MLYPATAALRAARSARESRSALVDAVRQRTPPRLIAWALSTDAAGLVEQLEQIACDVVDAHDFRAGDVIVRSAARPGCLLWRVAEPYRRPCFQPEPQILLESGTHPFVFTGDAAQSLVPARVIRAAECPAASCA
ncbi:hypothetical protein [Tsukamurella tyrosinosolvens]|uniref:hypothetical protein n=1 Tax=Tsukamurella tyrosinosolvens TaxID=57704 RepID=UPI000799CF3D|nr:hypothetical protein [Tsukamurella tyrosinosolvens]KXO91097.1 hypothetical protein AXK58_21955 [Tsukamurella tyrosinosolvens]